MRILVTNDDGVYSPGIAALANVAARFGQVRVVAPDVEQSGMSHAITIQRPLQYRRVHLGSLEAYQVNGTPADCVALGMYRWDGADLVLSGINMGSNLGHDVWVSGTVAGAKQGTLLGVRAAAFSLAVGKEDSDLSVLTPYIEEVINLILKMPSPFIVNANFPLNPTGLCWARQSVRSYSGRVIEDEDPMGRRIYWFAASPLTEPEEKTDRWAIDHDLVALTPLRMDLTDEDWLERLRDEGCPPEST